MGGGGAVTSATDVACHVVITQAGRIRNFVVMSASPPGVGETFVYTVRVNNAVSGLTVTVSGAADYRGQDLTNEFDVNVGDIITIRVVNSAGGADVAHIASIAYQVAI